MEENENGPWREKRRESQRKREHIALQEKRRQGKMGWEGEEPFKGKEIAHTCIAEAGRDESMQDLISAT
eukprot:1244000-Pleurochrysis_carterae.AAC.1